MIRGFATTVTALLIAALVTPTASVADPAANVPTGTVTGVVTDATTGQPLANDCDLTVHLSFSDGYFYDVKAVSGCLDAQGQYTITGIPTDTYSLYVTDSSGTYYPQWDNGDSSKPNNSDYNNGNGVLEFQATNGATTTENIALTAAASIIGTIDSAATSQPIAKNCALQIEAVPEENFGEIADGAAKCTDDSGQYTIAGLEPGNYIVSAGTEFNPRNTYRRRFDYFQEKAEVTTTVGNDAVAPTLDLTKPASLRVVFRSAAKGHRLLRNARGAEVLLRAGRSLGGFVGGSTAQDGSETVGNAAAGTYTVRAALRKSYGHRIWGDEGFVRLPSRVKLSAGHTTTRTVFLTSTPVPPRKPATKHTTKPQPKPKPKPAAGKPATISGTVTDLATGEPLANYCSLTIAVQESVVELPHEFPSAVTVKKWHGCLDSTGSFAISGVPTVKTSGQKYSLLFADTSPTGYESLYFGEDSEPSTPYPSAGAGFSADEYLSIDGATLFNVPSGAQATGKDITLAGDGTITGHIYDLETGQPLDDVCGVLSLGDSSQQLCTAADGSYSLPGILTPETIDLNFSLAGYQDHAPEDAQRIDLAPSQTVTGIDAYLVPESS